MRLLVLIAIVAMACFANATPQAQADPYPKCPGCLAVAELIGPLVRANVSRAIIYDIAVLACEIMKPQCNTTEACKDLCLGVVREHMDEVLDIILRTALAPPEVCFLINMCPEPPPPPKPSGKIPVPSNCSDHTGERPWPSWSKKTGSGYFVQLTDIHIDPKYTPGMNTICGQPLCCRQVNGPGNETWNTAGKWGDYNCDTPVDVVESLFKHIASLNPPPDFILYTGDDVPHDIWEQSRDWNLLTIAKVNALFNQYFHDIPIFSTIGNHEAFPVNQFEGPPYDNWLYDKLAVDWAYYLPADAVPTLRYAGYYTARVRPGLRVISLNSNYYMNENFWLVANHTDFSSQLVWAADVFKQAEALGEKVIVIGHASSASWEQEFTDQWHTLVEKYQNILLGQYHGHAHDTDLRVWRDNATDSVPISIGYLSGSVVPYTDYNPGWRKYSYSRELTSRWLAEDYDQHWMDLDLANKQGAINDWGVVRFSAKAYFNLTDLSPASWQKYAQRLMLDDSLWLRHMHQYYRGAEARRSGDWPDRRGCVCDALSTSDAQWKKCMSKLLALNGENPLVTKQMFAAHVQRENDGC